MTGPPKVFTNKACVFVQVPLERMDRKARVDSREKVDPRADLVNPALRADLVPKVINCLAACLGVLDQDR